MTPESIKMALDRENLELQDKIRSAQRATDPADVERANREIAEFLANVNEQNERMYEQIYALFEEAKGRNVELSNEVEMLRGLRRAAAQSRDENALARERWSAMYQDWTAINEGYKRLYEETDLMLDDSRREVGRLARELASASASAPSPASSPPIPLPQPLPQPYMARAPRFGVSPPPRRR